MKLTLTPMIVTSIFKEAFDKKIPLRKAGRGEHVKNIRLMESYTKQGWT